jgi:hypothetical protein
MEFAASATRALELAKSIPDPSLILILSDAGSKCFFGLRPNGQGYP